MTAGVGAGCGAAICGVVSSATMVTCLPQCGQSRRAAGCAPVAGGGAGLVRGGPAGRAGLSRRQAAVLQAGLQVRRVLSGGMGPWQIGQVRVSAGTAGHRLTEFGGVALVGA